MRLGEYLIEKGLITKEELDIALKEQAITKEKLGNILVRFGFIKRDQLIDALSVLNPETLIGEGSLYIEIPNSVLLRLKTIILGDTGDTLYLATITNPEEVKKEIEKYIPETREIKFVPFEVSKLLKHLKDLEKEIESERAGYDLEDANLTLNKMLRKALKEGASDIHIEPSEKSVMVRYRIDGVLQIKDILPQAGALKLISLIKNKANMDIAETRSPQDGSFSFEYKGRTIDLRVSTLPSVNGEKVTIRILDKEKAIIDIKNLGITKLDEWMEISALSTGIILVCGATGSGKTTTLYSTVQYLDKLHKSIYTIEDPVEYKLPFITQVQVNRKVGLDFARFLRTVLRHDPDVIIVGEIRDRETAENAIKLADTGHLVYATLHTNDIPSTLVRLKGLGIDLLELSYLLRGILVQKLVRVICKVCSGKGCDYCSDTGYKGRTLLTEFVKIEKPEEVEGILQGTKSYYTFLEDAKYKVSKGITTKQEVERVLGYRLGGE